MGKVVYRTAIPQLIKALHEGAKQGVHDVADAVQGRATQDCPTDSGFMQGTAYQLSSEGATGDTTAGSSGGGYTAEPPEAPSDDLAVLIAYSAYYALFVHEGHHTRSGSMVAGIPWFLAAVNAITPKAAGIFTQALTAAIADVALPE